MMSGRAIGMMFCAGPRTGSAPCESVAQLRKRAGRHQCAAQHFPGRRRSRPPPCRQHMTNGHQRGCTCPLARASKHGIGEVCSRKNTTCIAIRMPVAACDDSLSRNPEGPGHPPGPLMTYRHDDSRQNVRLQLSIRPVSWLALSFTRSFHVPFRGSLDRFRV